MYDLVIKNGRIIDGTGSPFYTADIAVRDGKILRVAKGIEGGKQVIDASGLTVTPGFIDSHSHVDREALTHPDQVEKIEQGITLSVAGQCGSAVAPVDRAFTPENSPEIGTFGKQCDVYRTMGTFLNIAGEVPMGAHLAMLVGHGALRRAVMGTENRAPTPEELEKMKALLREGIENGALGLSYGLIYVPGTYAKTDELIELAKVAGEYNALVAAHIRNEKNDLIKATEEFITIIRESGTRGVLSHHKAAQKENWGKVTHTLRMIDEANESGVEIYCDVYPYCASSTRFSTPLIPKEWRAGGVEEILRHLADPEDYQKNKERICNSEGSDLSWIMIANCKGHPEYAGMRVSEIAKLRGQDDFDAAMDLIRDSEDDCRGIFFTMCEEDVETVMAHPRAMIGTDSGIAVEKVYHPRLKATFPRALGHYVRKRKVVSLQEMIRKMTSMPAAVYGLKNKGLLVEGFDADICIFDAEKIIDRSEFSNCNQRAEGLNYVILGGQVVVEDSVYNGRKMGRVILREV